MLKRPQFRTLARIGLAVLCVPVCLAGTCPGTVPPPPPPPPGDTILFDQTVSATGGACGLAPACAGQTNVFFGNFNTAAAGKLVTATVTGATTASRPRFQIFDTAFALVLDSGASPTTNSVTATFTPSAAGLHFIQVCNCGFSPAPTYTIRISQAP